MSEVQTASGTRLTLEIWHPDCWAIEATEEVGGGVLAHAIYNSPKSDGPTPDAVNGLFTAYGDDMAEVDTLLETISETETAGNLFDLQQRFGRERSAPGNVVREFFLEYDPDDMICPTLLKHGLVHSAPVRIEGGRETWQVCYTGDRSDLEDALEGVRQDANAEVTVASIHSADWDGDSARHHRLDTLTTAQREAFEHAREAGYYNWPREISTRELAEGLDVSKTTLLEHLRKAEAKLLDPEEK
jgi:predicted DNA binding protein